MSRNRINVPGSESALEKMKYEIAGQMNVNLKQGYNGNLTSRENGTVGGYMVKNVYPVRTITKTLIIQGFYTPSFPKRSGLAMIESPHTYTGKSGHRYICGVVVG